MKKSVVTYISDNVAHLVHSIYHLSAPLSRAEGMQKITWPLGTDGKKKKKKQNLLEKQTILF